MGIHTLTLPNYLPPTLNTLLRKHWSKRHKATNEAATMCVLEARNQNVPVATVKRKVSFIFRQSKGKLADHDARLKVALDMLVGSRLLVDDSPAWLDSVSVRSERGERATVVELEDVE